MYYFIVNLTSRTGKTKKIWADMETYMKKEGVEYQAYITQYGGHARELADALCTEIVEKKKEDPTSRQVLAVLGGDGTVNEVINGMHDFDQVEFGYVPAGSGNDLGRGLGISKDPLKALTGMLQATCPDAMDLGCVIDENGVETYYSISSGIGIDAHVCRMTINSKLKKALNFLGIGSLTYILLTVKALFTMPTTRVEAVFDGTRKMTISDMIFVAGMNHIWEGGGVPMSPMANYRDGKLSVCCVYGIPRWKAFLLLPLLASGKHEKLKGFEFIDSENYELILEKPMSLHADGEFLGMHTKISYRCEKGKLLVLKG